MKEINDCLKLRWKSQQKEKEISKKNSSEGSWKQSGEEAPVGNQKIIYTWQE